MQSFSTFSESLSSQNLNSQLDVIARKNMNIFLKMPRDLQIMFIAYELIVSSHYKQRQQVVDFINFVFPDHAPNQTLTGNRLNQFIDTLISHIR